MPRRECKRKEDTVAKREETPEVNHGEVVQRQWVVNRVKPHRGDGFNSGLRSESLRETPTEKIQKQSCLSQVKIPHLLSDW